MSSRESEGPQDGYWQEFVGLSWNRSDVEGMVADLHVSSVEVSARPLAGGDDGLTLLLRVQNVRKSMGVQRVSGSVFREQTPSLPDSSHFCLFAFY